MDKTPRLRDACLSYLYHTGRSIYNIIFNRYRYAAAIAFPTAKLKHATNMPHLHIAYQPGPSNIIYTAQYSPVPITTKTIICGAPKKSQSARKTDQARPIHAHVFFVQTRKRSMCYPKGRTQDRRKWYSTERRRDAKSC